VRRKDATSKLAFYRRALRNRRGRLKDGRWARAYRFLRRGICSKKAKVVFKIHAPRDDSSIASRLDL
jgi:hypothetical protein